MLASPKLRLVTYRICSSRLHGSMSNGLLWRDDCIPPYNILPKSHDGRLCKLFATQNLNASSYLSLMPVQSCLTFFLSADMNQMTNWQFLNTD